MGNKHGKKLIEGPKNNSKIQNEHARKLLKSVNSIPSELEIKIALAIQQSKTKGPLKKTDLIAILIRLNPSRDNALISQFKVNDLISLIRYELYVHPFENLDNSPKSSDNGVKIEEIA